MANLDSPTSSALAPFPGQKVEKCSRSRGTGDKYTMFRTPLNSRIYAGWSPSDHQSEPTSESSVPRYKLVAVHAESGIISSDVDQDILQFRFSSIVFGQPASLGDSEVPGRDSSALSFDLSMLLYTVFRPCRSASHHAPYVVVHTGFPHVFATSLCTFSLKAMRLYTNTIGWNRLSGGLVYE